MIPDPLECHLLQKMENSRHDLLIVAVWCHWPKPTQISMSCSLFLDLNDQGIQTSGKSKRELKILCKHQDNCEREMKVLGKEVKGRIIAGFSGTRMDWNNVAWQIDTYQKKEAMLLASVIYTKACATWRQYSYLDFINEEVDGWSMWGKSGLRFSWCQRPCLAELADEGIE